MRSLLTRLALVGIVGVAISGCGTTSGSSLPAGGSEGAGGGGPTVISNQAPSAGTVPGLLVDGGVKAYTGYNTTATDTLLTTAQEPTDTGGKTAPADVAGSHSISYAGNGLTQQIFAFSGNPVNLVETLTSPSPGDVMPLDFGAIVFFATPPATASSLSIELTGGSGTTTYDVRIACVATAVPVPTSSTPLPQPVDMLKNRYVCALPAYGAASSTNFVNPVVSASASGTFTPQTAKLYLVVNDSTPYLASAAASTLLVDYLYAEQGTV